MRHRIGRRGRNLNPDNALTCHAGDVLGREWIRPSGVVSVSEPGGNADLALAVTLAHPPCRRRQRSPATSLERAADGHTVRAGSKRLRGASLRKHLEA